MIRVHVDNKATPGLIRVAAALQDTKSVNRRISIALFAWVQRNFKSNGAMQSPTWAPLAPSTTREKTRLGYSPQALLRTGNLRNSFHSYYDERLAGVGARASYFRGKKGKSAKEPFDYATAHQFGTRRIPARPMLPPEKYARDVAVAMYKNFVGAATNPKNVAKAIGGGAI